MGKGKHKISNWKHYNQALVNRNSVTCWIDDPAIKALPCLKHHGHRARGLYSQIPRLKWH